ncbi:MAG: glycosyltransferase family 2 protein [Candidatus Omnitrophica bacterium]|nr:glycosyltransferase family 2 protein [Candidatus Omnitrophota bacterium]
MYTDLNIIIPVYNEGPNINKAFSMIARHAKMPYFPYVIYDFDEDDTLPAVRELMKKDKRICLLKNKYGRGSLNAIRTGFDAVKEGVVLVMMADLCDDLNIINDMFKKINDGNDLVCGSRYMKGGKQLYGPVFKGFLSRVAGLSLHHLTKISTHDVTNSFKMYTKDLLNAIEIESTGGFELGMEITVKAYVRGYRIAEVPSVWSGRVSGRSRFRFRSWLPGYIRWYIYAIQHRNDRKNQDRGINGQGS